MGGNTLKSKIIDELMRLYHAYGWFNGSVLVAEAGQVIYEQGLGWANLEWRIPNQPDTKFRLGSITKQFTAVLILQLVEQGKLQLAQKVSEVLPWYRPDSGGRISIHNLLTHTSGVPNYTDTPDFMEIERNHFAVRDFAEKYCSGDLEFEPGTRYSYSNSGYFLLGAIIEATSGKTYEEMLNERIFTPLGMTDSGCDSHARIIERRACGYERDYDDITNCAYIDMSIPFAAGAIYSTVRDLYKWDRALYTEQLLTEQCRQLLYTPFLENYAYGWAVDRLTPEHVGQFLIRGRAFQDEGGHLIAEHNGGIDGFSSLIVRDLSARHLVVLLSNFGEARLEEMAANVLQVIYGLDYQIPRRSIADLLHAVIREEGLEAG
jgi:CubicO group peptidase (beta-lactamase class C family)